MTVWHTFKAFCCVIRHKASLLDLQTDLNKIDIWYKEARYNYLESDKNNKSDTDYWKGKSDAYSRVLNYERKE